MALTLSSAILFGASLLFAACALFWPQLQHAYLFQSGSSPSKLVGKCPLGYEGHMPAHHPPVLLNAGQQAAPTDDQQHNQPRSSSSVGVAAAFVGRPIVIYMNGNIWTANPQSPWATSITVDVDSGSIVAVGGDSPASNNSVSDSRNRGHSMVDKDAVMTIVDLHGAFVMPGFVDPHAHLIPSGLALSDVNLRHISSKAELIQRVAERAAVARQQQHAGVGGNVSWLLGGGWSEHEWGGELPDASWIDKETGDIPAVFLRMDYHMAWVNTAALRAAGLLEPGAHMDEPGVDRYTDGTPTGLLREAAMDIVRQHVPSPSVPARKAALAAAGQYLLSRGVTSVGDMGWGLFGLPNDTWNDLELVYDWAAQQEKLPLRIVPYVPLNSWQRLSRRISVKGDHHESDRLFWGGVKEFADGSLGSSSALFWEPYADSPSGNQGMRPIPHAELERLVVGAAGAGLQVAVHAIGDRAVDEVLEVFEQVDGCDLLPGGPRCWPHRVEHTQHISGAVSAAKMGSLNIMAIPNPQHLISDKEIMLAKLGPERAGAGRSHAYRTLTNMGVAVAFGSDWPVADIDPFESIYISVYRAELPRQQSHSGHCFKDTGTLSVNTSADPRPPPIIPKTSLKSWAPEERLPLDQVLMSHTAVPARAIRLSHSVGSLQVGYKADFVLLDKSPFQEFASDATEMEGGCGSGVPRVVRTYLDGACVHGCHTELTPSIAVT